MIELLKLLYERFILRARNIGYGRCRWGGPHCRDHRRRWCVVWFGLDRVRLLKDEGMCWPCYEVYCEKYK
jgi:hypothetical protein